MNTNLLKIKQLDKRIQKLNKLQEIAFPKIGWIKLIRNILNLTSKKLGNKLNISSQAV